MHVYLHVQYTMYNNEVKSNDFRPEKPPENEKLDKRTTEFKTREENKKNPLRREENCYRLGFGMPVTIHHFLLSAIWAGI